MSLHSSVVGGSSAARLLNCPGSAALQATLPKVVERDSFYSLEGTALHDLMVQLATGKVSIDKLPKTVEAKGEVIDIPPALVHDAVIPAWEYWQDFLTKVDTWQLETRVEFPGVKGAFGTADVLGRDDRDNITYLTDWKFGAGEGVKAAYLDPDDPFCEIVNEQLLFYACAARHTQPNLFPPGCRIMLTIVQPRARGQEPITVTEVTLDELDDFVVAMRAAVNTAAMINPPTRKGRWCRFQPCQTICPHHTGALFNIEQLTMQVPAVLEDKRSDYQVTLLDILDAAPAVEALIKEARAQAHLIMSNGGEVPGWKLVAKRGTRQWTTDAKIIAKKLRIPEKKLYDITLKSPAGVEKILPGKTKLPEGLATMVSSGTTIARADDKRPAIAADPNEMGKILLEVLNGEE